MGLEFKVRGRVRVGELGFKVRIELFLGGSSVRDEEICVLVVVVEGEVQDWDVNTENIYMCVCLCKRPQREI